MFGVYYCSTYYEAVLDGTREEPSTLTQGSTGWHGILSS
jgi:hypothetical protein